MPSGFMTRIQQFGDAEAIIDMDVVETYAALSVRVARWSERFARRGIGPARVVALQASCGIDACAALIALIGSAAVVVPLTNVPATKLAEAKEIAQVESVVTIGPDEWDIEATTGRVADHPLYQRLRSGSAQRAGLVLFSSGTTGRSKASLLDFSRLLARYQGSRPARRTLSFLNLDHIGGINTLFHTLGHGGAIITIADRAPDSVLAAVAKHRANVLPTTPTFLNMMLIAGAHQRHDLSSLELITYGTEPMPGHTLDRLSIDLPRVRLKQTYGLSELGILPTRSRADGSLWMKLGGEGFEYKIVGNVLWIRADTAMLGYLNAPAPFDEEGFFNTQDIVETDGEYVRVLGRSTEIINVGGEKVYPSEVESVLLELSNVADVTVSGEPSPVTGMVVKATILPVVPEPHRDFRQRIRRHCLERLQPYKVPVVIEFSDSAQHSERFKKLRKSA